MAHITTKIDLYANKKVNFKTEVKLRDDSFGEGIYIYEWNLDIPKPTMEQLDAFEAQANTIEQNEVIKATRKNLYGPLDKQLEEIYDNGIDSWKTRIAQIKTNNPKV
jgi:septation ring formation regulator EzrA